MSKFKKVFSIFLTEDEGAVTVDWIAMTATILFLGMATAFYVSTSVPFVAEKLSSFLDNGGV